MTDRLPVKALRGVALSALWALACSHATQAAPVVETPGCAWVLTQGQHSIQTGGHGLTSLEQGRAIDADTLFNVASVSKQFTALAVLLLAADQALQLDDALHRHLPELPTALGRPTLRQLLAHRGGLPDYIEPLLQTRAHERVTARETLDVLAHHDQPRFAPGTRFEYSNTGYFLLAQVVERVSGQSLREFSGQRIFRPLGMHATRVVDRYPLPEVAPPGEWARGYRSEGDGKFVRDESLWEQVGDGQVHTSARDMGRWLLHLDADTPLVTRDGAATPGVRSLLLGIDVRAQKKRVDYRNGLEARVLNGHGAWVHAGGWAGYASLMAWLPQSRRAVALLCNRSDLDMRGRLRQLLKRAP